MKARYSRPTAPSLRSYVVIPARYASTRLPRKMLLRDTGCTLLEHTWRQAQQATRPLGVLVATDDQRILEEVRGFGGKAVLTHVDCASGTDRVAEVARSMLGHAEILVNVQGDEPEIDPAAIDRTIELLEQDVTIDMSTVAAPIRSREHLQDSARVKVVFDERGHALYFSRSPIPHLRDGDDSSLTACPPRFFQHMGLYAYRRSFLLQLAELPASPLEQCERLEQLRVLQAGHRIRVGVVPRASAGIDTPEDYADFVQRTRAAA